jgi:hypothetical protein
MSQIGSTQTHSDLEYIAEPTQIIHLRVYCMYASITAIILYTDDQLYFFPPLFFSNFVIN